MGASLAILGKPQEAPLRGSLGLGQELKLAVGSQGSSLGWTMVDSVRVRRGVGCLRGSSCFKMRGVLTFHSTGGLSGPDFEHKVSRGPALEKVAVCNSISLVLGRPLVLPLANSTFSKPVQMLLLFSFGVS